MCAVAHSVWLGQTAVDRDRLQSNAQFAIQTHRFRNCQMWLHLTGRIGFVVAYSFILLSLRRMRESPDFDHKPRAFTSLALRLHRTRTRW